MEKPKQYIQYITSANLPTKFGLFKMYGFLDQRDEKEHIAMVYGDVAHKHEVTTRIHSECMTGDIFGSLKCDCGDQLFKALKKISCEKHGVILYLRQEGRGIGLLNKIKAYHLQDQGYDTLEANLQLGFPADNRTYDIAAEIIKYLKIKSINLLTNNPEKIIQLKNAGIRIKKRIEHATKPNKYNVHYLTTKNIKFGHQIPLTIH